MYACIIAKKLHHNTPIRMVKVHTNWKRLKFNDDDVMKDGKSILEEWEMIQKRFNKDDYNM